jgi:phosphoketolase
VFDNPDLLVACIVGDGEAETGPTATAWHGTKFLDPVESGAVLPILHVNGYKISNPTIFGSCPPLAEYAVELRENKRGEPEKGPVEILAKYLAKVIIQNPSNFRIFSPDELMSNKLGGIFEAPTQRNYQWPIESGDRAEHIGSRGGRVLEILSEHT